MTSSRLTPAPNRRARAHKPPIERAASSRMVTTPVGADAQLDVHRAFDEPKCRGRSGRGGLDGGEDRGRLPGRRDVDGLLEKGAVQGIGLVEHGQHLQLASRSRPSTATSAPDTKRSTSKGSGLSPTMARIRTPAASAWIASSTRMTPWLADREMGLTTHGYPTSVAAEATSASRATIR